MEMDKRAYLEEIAVKGKQKTSGPLFSPKIIKFLAVGIVLLITLLLVGVILNKENTGLSNSYQKLYLRVKNLSASNSPINTYGKKLKSSDLRAYNTTLATTLKAFETDINATLPSTGVDLAAIPAEVTNAETAILNNYSNKLETGYLNGQLDRTYATETYYQITLLIALEREIAAETDSTSLKNTLGKYIQSLTTIQTNYKNYIDNH